MFNEILPELWPYIDCSWKLICNSKQIIQRGRKPLFFTIMRSVSKTLWSFIFSWYQLVSKLFDSEFCSCWPSEALIRRKLSRRFTISGQWIVIFPANWNRNRFAEPTSVRIGMGIVREFQNLLKGIIFVWWEVFANY